MRQRRVGQHRTDRGRQQEADLLLVAAEDLAAEHAAEDQRAHEQLGAAEFHARRIGHLRAKHAPRQVRRNFRGRFNS